MDTFTDIKNDVATLAQRSGDSDYLTKIGVWVNIAYRILANSYDYWRGLQKIYNFTTVASQEAYRLPWDFDKPLRIFDLTNENKLTIKTEEEYLDSHLGSLTDTGEANIARIFGEDAIDTQISTAGTVTAESSDANDGSAFSVLVRGYIDSNYKIEDFETIALNGTTAVAGTKTFYRITGISKSGDTSGYITIKRGTTTLVTLDREERVARRKVLYLGENIPDSADSFRILYKRKVKKLVQDLDYPFVDCSNFLIYHAFAQSLKQDKEDQRAEFAWRRADQELLTLITNEGSSLGPDYQHKIISGYISAHRIGA